MLISIVVWQCMDTVRDKEILEKHLKNKNYFE